MDSVTRKRLEDIQRLMQAAGTVGEAEAAAAAMQRLILKHNLTADDLSTIGGEKKEAYEGMFIQVAPNKTPGLQWRLNLLYTLARYNFCAFVRNGVHGGDGIIVGQPSNQEAVRDMFFQTVETVERLGNSEWSAFRGRTSDWIQAGGPGPMVWKNSFKLGFAHGLNLKMKLERQTEQNDDHRVSALVVTKDHELKLAVEEVIGKTRMAKGSGPNNRDGFGKGVEKGRAHELSEKLGGGLKELMG